MHIHIGILSAIITFAEVLVVGILWRVLSALNHDNAFGQAMAFAY